jgi:hypothetical protein
MKNDLVSKADLLDFEARFEAKLDSKLEEKLDEHESRIGNLERNAV